MILSEFAEQVRLAMTHGLTENQALVFVQMNQRERQYKELLAGLHAIHAQLDRVDGRQLD